MHHRSARLERAIIVIQLNKYESRDRITEQDKRVVPRKGVELKEKGKNKKFCISHISLINYVFVKVPRKGKGVKKKKGKKDNKFCIASPLS